MELVKTRALTPAQEADIRALEEECRSLMGAVVTLGAAAFGEPEAESAPVVERFFSLPTVTP